MIAKLFAKLSGRTTAFCGAFFLTGHILAWLHRLDGTYIAFMVALLGGVIGHSVKEDIFPAADPQKDVKE
jgi:hypothetical protein